MVWAVVGSHSLALADQWGRGVLGTQVPLLGSISFIFMQFSEKFLPNKFLPQTQGFVPPGPRLENLGYSTVGNLGYATV